LSATELKTVAGKVESTAKGKILEFAWYLKREGNTDPTIRTYASLLRKVDRLNANILDPESVKDVLAKVEMNSNTKATIIAVYSSFVKFLGLTWKAPKCKYQRVIPFIPLESELDDLVSGCSRSLSALLLTLKETGMRIGEALRLKWMDVNTQNNTLSLNKPEKNGTPRIFSVSAKLISMIQGLPKQNDYVYGSSSVATKQSSFKVQRLRLSKKLANPRLNQIHFHTFRHWKGTMEYHLTHDVVHVQNLLGHSDITNTMIYINMENSMFKNKKEDEFHTVVAENLEDACGLLDVGFERVGNLYGKEVFRKRK
jgi:integrase